MRRLQTVRVSALVGAQDIVPPEELDDGLVGINLRNRFGLLNEAGNAIVAELVTPMSVRSQTPVFVTDAMNLERSVAVRPSHRWEIETKLHTLAEAPENLYTLLVKKGNFGTMQIKMPQPLRYINDNSPLWPKPRAVGNVGSTTITIYQNPGKIFAGMFIRFSNHNKVYMVMNDLFTASGSIEIYPGLFKRVKHRFSLTCTKMDVLMDLNNIAGMTFVDGINHDVGTLKFIEQL